MSFHEQKYSLLMQHKMSFKALFKDFSTQSKLFCLEYLTCMYKIMYNIVHICCCV